MTFPAQREPGLGHTLRATGPDGESTTLEDIAIGDVWLCSGQSNMDMNYGWRLTRGREDIESADDPMMRLFDDHNAAAEDCHVADPAPEICRALPRGGQARLGRRPCECPISD